MILKALKEKSNQKFVNNILLHRKVKVPHKKLKTVGILFNATEFTDYEKFSKLFNTIGDKSISLRFMVFSKKKENTNLKLPAYTAKDFGFKGHLRNVDLQDFTNSTFDVLICYFLANDLELKQIAAMSKAQFKVGISITDDRLYDLIIALKPNQFSDFEHELKKYLTLLKII